MLNLPKQEPPVYKPPRGDERERLIRMRTALVMGNPFFGLLACRLKLAEKPEVGTAATDGKNLYYNPSYIAGMDDHALRGLWAHEVMHIVGGHCWRRGSRDHKLWNAACDYAIDPVLVRARFRVPNALVNPSWQGWSAEQIYAALLEEVQKECERRNQDAAQEDASGEQGQTGGEEEGGDAAQSGGGGEHKSDSSDKETESAQSGGGDEPGVETNEGEVAGSGSPEGKEGGKPRKGGRRGVPSFQQAVAELLGEGPTKGEVLDAPAETALQDEQEWKQAVSAAAQVAKSQGKLPAGFDRVVEDAVTPRVDWRAVLMRFVQAIARSDYSWERPSRRYVSSGIYLPSLRSRAIPELVLAVDTSGSIGQHELRQFSAEFGAIMEALDIEVTHLVFADASVQRTAEFRPGDTLAFRPTGGGGTDFRPVFRWVEESGIEPSGLVYLTDMLGSFPSEAPPYPVLWASTTKESMLGSYAPPFGEFVYLDFE